MSSDCHKETLQPSTPDKQAEDLWPNEKAAKSKPQHRLHKGRYISCWKSGQREKSNILLLKQFLKGVWVWVLGLGLGLGLGLRLGLWLRLWL